MVDLKEALFETRGKALTRSLSRLVRNIIVIFEKHKDGPRKEDARYFIVALLVFSVRRAA